MEEKTLHLHIRPQTIRSVYQDLSPTVCLTPASKQHPLTRFVCRIDIYIDRFINGQSSCPGIETIVAAKKVSMVNFVMLHYLAILVILVMAYF
jgi:hypothetical protein